VLHCKRKQKCATLHCIALLNCLHNNRYLEVQFLLCYVSFNVNILPSCWYIYTHSYMPVNLLSVFVVAYIHHTNYSVWSIVMFTSYLQSSVNTLVVMQSVVSICRTVLLDRREVYSIHICAIYTPLKYNHLTTCVSTNANMLSPKASDDSWTNPAFSSYRM
jgi:hypothetical protein